MKREPVSLSWRPHCHSALIGGPVVLDRCSPFSLGEVKVVGFVAVVVIIKLVVFVIDFTINKL